MLLSHKILILFLICTGVVIFVLPDSGLPFFLNGSFFCFTAFVFIYFSGQISKKVAIRWLFLTILVTAVAIFTGPLIANWRLFSVSVIYGFLLPISIQKINSEPNNRQNILLYLASSCLFLLLQTAYGLKFGSSMFYFLDIAFILPMSLGLYFVSIRKKIFYSYLVAIILFVLVSFPVQKNYFSFLQAEKLPINKNVFSTFKLINHKYDTDSLVNLPQKVVVLDFWFVNCGLCFKKFPEYEKLYQRYKNDPDVLIAAVNYPLPKDKSDAFITTLSSLGYHFSPYKVVDTSDISKWGVEAYPTMFIFDKDRNVKYKGMLNIDPDIIVNNTISIIEEIKSEK
jgi:thiol-disulfide isomerase/thioredoxin